MQATGRLYDGTTAHPFSVAAEIVDGELRLLIDEEYRQAFPVSKLVRMPDSAGARFGRSDQPGWRLLLDPSTEPDFIAALPKPARYGKFIDRVGLGRAAVAFAGVAAVVLFIGYSAPHWLAPHVPESWEANLGDAIVGDFGDNQCAGTEGNAVLRRLAERVSPGSTQGPHGIEITALDVGIVNAAALPGRHIVFFDGMVKLAKSGDELAGVMAHEIAHVRRRHVTESLLRELGIGALVRLFAGGVGANAEQLVNLSYTRANEADADAEAVKMLAAAQVDPRPTAALFRRLDPTAARGDRTGFIWLESHPGIKGRAARFDASFRRGTAYRSALDPKDLQALLEACADKSE